MRFLVASVLGALVLLGCTRPAPRYESLVRWAGDLERERVDTQSGPEGRCREWRDAWRVPAGMGRAFDLGPILGRGVLRVGVLDQGQAGGRVKVRAYVGERRAAGFKTAGRKQWLDRRLDLSKYAASGENCHLVFDSPSPFWVGPCELVSVEDNCPGIVVFVIDALRLDHLGCYGYSRDTSPRIDVFARDAVTFTQLMPQSSWTRPSVGSLFTGVYPSVHGAEDRPDIMRKGLPTLAGLLKAAGYETHGFISNPNCLPCWGFGDEFDRYVDVNSLDWEKNDDADVLDEAIATLRDAAGRPCFLYVHTMSPHNPYTPPEPYNERFGSGKYDGTYSYTTAAEVVGQYDGEVAYADAQFGRLVDALEELGLYDSAIIVLLSDHGEEFWEHGNMYHGTSLFEELLRVPLLIKMPGGAYAGERRDALVELVDIAPTILDIVGAPPETRFQGSSFLGLIETGQAHKSVGYASLVLESRSLRASKTGKIKYVHDLVEPSETWYDLEQDPAERSPLEQPVSAGERLSQHAALTAARGSHGLHMLFTADPCTDHVITGTLQGEGFGTVNVRYPSRPATVTRGNDSVEFRIKMTPLRPEDVMEPEQLAVLEQDHARLYAEMDYDTELILSVQVDGRPIREDRVYMGTDGRHVALDGTALAPRDLLAGPEAFVAAALPKRFALYVWYVPRVETVPDEELDPEMAEALRGLGYLN